METGKHLAYIVKQALDKGIETLEVSQEAEDQWVEAVIRLADLGSEFSSQCTPGYYNNEGNPSKTSRQNGFYFDEPKAFEKILEDWREDGGMKGLELG